MMESKEYYQCIDDKFSRVDVDKQKLLSRQLIENISSILRENKLTLKDIYTRFRFTKQTIRSAITNGKSVSKEEMRFIREVGVHILKEYSEQYFFDVSIMRFIRKEKLKPKQFTIGTYYGYFLKRENTTPFHFIILSQRNQILTLYGDKREYIGELEVFETWYSCVLKEVNGDGRKIFLIGNNNRDVKEKTFIGTWYSSQDGQAISSLCYIVLDKGSSYDTIEKIKKNEAIIEAHIINQMPESAKNFFKEQTTIHLIKQSSAHDPS